MIINHKILVILVKLNNYKITTMFYYYNGQQCLLIRTYNKCQLLLLLIGFFINKK